MSNTKKEIIIEAFEQMDMNMLEVVLDDNRTYQDATKETFLKKLASAFQEIKDKNVLSLKAHKGFCNSDECPNKGCNGYAFVDDVSKQYISLIFDETEDDVSDIYNCNAFKTEDELKLASENRVYFIINIDEQANFKPDVTFIIKDQQCQKAIDELDEMKASIIDKEFMERWIIKHRDLKESFHIPPLFYVVQKEFYFKYLSLEEVYGFTKCEHECKTAYEEYHDEEAIDELILLKWASKYEELNKKLTLFFIGEDDLEHQDNISFFAVEQGYKINALDFENVIKFKELHDSYYWGLLNKYTTYTDTDELWDGKDKEYNDNRISLTYHLKARGIID